MKKQRIFSEHVAEPKPRLWSNCLRVGDVAYVSGMTARAKDGETVLGEEYEQSKVIFGKIRDLVEAAGARWTMS